MLNNELVYIPRPRTDNAKPSAFQAYGAFRQVFKLMFQLLATGFLLLLCALPARSGSDATILAIGDSLTAGYGLNPDQSFPAQLQSALQDQGHNVIVRNAGVSGDTTTGGLSRLDWIVEGTSPRPDLVILEFGANDALRGIDPELTRRNMDAMLEYLTENQYSVLFTGMLAPPNMGEDYAGKFNAIFPDLAEKYQDQDVVFDPFFLEGVAADPALNQNDGMHPNPEGVAVIVKRLLPRIVPLIETE